MHCSANIGVDTEGSGGSMNRGPRAPGAPSAEPQKIMQENNLPISLTSLATWKSNFTKDRLHENVGKMPPDAERAPESVWRPGSSRTR